MHKKQCIQKCSMSNLRQILSQCIQEDSRHRKRDENEPDKYLLEGPTIKSWRFQTLEFPRVGGSNKLNAQNLKPEQKMKMKRNKKRKREEKGRGNKSQEPIMRKLPQMLIYGITRLKLAYLFI